MGAEIDKNLIHEGDIVFPNDIVGYIGNTGHCKSGGIDMNGDIHQKKEKPEKMVEEHICICSCI